MNDYGRRRFLGTCASATGLWMADLQFLHPISQAIAQETTVIRDGLQHGPEIAPIVRLIHSTPRADCVEVFVKELKNGLTYQRFLAALFLAASETGDLHQLAQIYAAHRTSESARVEERFSLSSGPSTESNTGTSPRTKAISSAISEARSPKRMMQPALFTTG